MKPFTKFFTLTILVASLTFALQGCGKNDDAPAAGAKAAPGANVNSCNIGQLVGSCLVEEGCIDFGAGNQVGQDVIRKSCNDSRGKFSTRACPTQDLVGSCKFAGRTANGSFEQFYRFYKNFGATHEELKKMCEMMSGGQTHLYCAP